MKKIVSFLLTLVMLMPLASAALGEGTPTEINVMVWYRDMDDLDFANMPYYNDPKIGITAQTGVHANFDQFKDSEFKTKLNLSFASGDYPDIVIRGNVNLEMYGVDQEILIPLDDYIDQYMPVYKSRLEADPVLAQSLRSSDGHIYQVGWIVPQNINTDSHLFINRQWLDNLGLSLPTTLDEYEQCLYAIKEGDANGNGDPNDEIPVGGTYNVSVDGITHMFSFWGVPFNDSYIALDDNGKVYSPLQSDGLRSALERVSKWYQDGLIDIETVTQDTASFETKVHAETYGSFWRWRMTAKGTAPEVCEHYECLVPFSAEGYQATLPRYLEIPSFGAAITSAAVQNGTVEACCRWLDAQLEKDNMISGYNGMKGEFWDYDENGKVDIFPVGTPTLTVPGQSAMYYMCGADYFDQVLMPSHRIEKTTYCENYEAAGVLEKNSRHILVKLVTLNVEESTRMELLKAEIQKYASEAITGFIVKGVTDEAWQTYQATLNNIGISDFVDLYQTAYDRYLAANQ